MATAFRRRVLRAEVVSVAAIAVSFFIVWPVGSYPVEDDWAFASTLLRLHETGEVRIVEWHPMSLVTHLFWGVLFTKGLGFSFTVTKLSTVALLVFECLGLIALLRQIGTSERLLTAAVLAVVFNPLHFFQSFLYATDVPALAWTTLALLAYSRGLGGVPRSRSWLLLGSAFATLALGIRQSGILVAAAAFLHLLLYARQRLASPRDLAAAFALPLVSTAAFAWWYYSIHGATEANREAQAAIVGQLLGLRPIAGGWIVYCLLAYLGFFLLPLMPALPLRIRRPTRTPRDLLALASCVALLAVFLWGTLRDGQRFPYISNKITKFGYLSPNEVIVGAREVLWPRLGGEVMSAVVGIAALALVWISIRGNEADGRRAVPDELARATTRLCALLLGLQLLYQFLTIGIAFDRHFLIFLPAAVVVFVARMGSSVRVPAWRFAPGLLLFAGYSLAGTHDVHAFSRAAFEAGEALIAEGVDPASIDAGYAFDGWYMYERSQRETREQRLPSRARAGRNVADAWYVRKLFPRIETRFVVSLSETMEWSAWRHAVSPWARRYAFLPRIGGYQRVRTHPYRSYWPPKQQRVFVLTDPTRRVESSVAGGSR